MNKIDMSQAHREFADHLAERPEWTRPPFAQVAEDRYEAVDGDLVYVVQIDTFRRHGEFQGAYFWVQRTGRPDRYSYYSSPTVRGAVFQATYVWANRHRSSL